MSPRRVASSLDIPTVLTVHGQVEPWAWYGQGHAKTLKKNTYWKMIGRPVFRHVSLVHAITPLERQHLEPLFPNKEIIVIPNAVNLSEMTTESETESQVEKRILFLGRVHPVKRIDWLIKSFANARLSEKWRLVIAGPKEDENYLLSLYALVRSLGLDGQVSFVGSIYGEEKKDLIQTSWVVVVPSFSEVVGMVNLEAGAFETPSITTLETGLLDWEDGGGVLISGRDDDALRQALTSVSHWTLNERIERGRKSRQLVEQRYSMDKVGEQWLEVYNQLLEFRS